MKKLQLVVPLTSYRQMMAYVELAKGEVTWFFDVEFDAALDAFVVGQVYLLPQEASGALVEMSENDVTDMMLKMMDDGVEQLPRGWGHSHVNMDAFFSSTDVDTINNSLANGTYIVAFVTNKRHDYEAVAKFHYADFDYQVDLELTVDYTFEDIPEEYRLEVEEKVKYLKPKNEWYKYGGKKYPAKQVPKQLNSGVYTNNPDDDYSEYYSLDPVIQEQFKIAGAERGSMRIHEVPLSDDIPTTANSRICTKCWTMENRHNDNPDSCGNPNYLPFDQAYEWKESSK